MSAPLLLFAHRGQRYLVESVAVSEVIALPKVTRMPAPPPFVRGVINHHGSVLPVVDSDGLLGVGVAPEGEQPATALILAGHETRFVFPVDVTLGLEGREGLGDSSDPSVDRVVALQGKAVNVVRLGDLLAALEGGAGRPADDARGSSTV